MRRRIRSRGVLRSRVLVLNLDRLETRDLLTSGSVAGMATGTLLYPMFQAVPYTNPTPPASAFTPAQIAAAYGFDKVSFNGVKGDGTGQTIAIVDAYDYPTVQADLDKFSAQFGLPSTTVKRVSQTGGTNYPATDSTGGWELEAALDVQWAHAMAPGATILLVEAASAYDSDLLAAVDYAAAHASVVSMSWGGSEFAGQTTYDSHFSHAGVSFVASSGDSGAPISWPAASANVLAVGGTSLYVGAGSTWSSEIGWSGSGGGPSAYVTKPAYQANVATSTTKRANPDVAYNGDPNTGFAVYDSFAYNGSVPGWLQIGGTSAGAPQWAALLAIVDQGRALSGLPALDATSPQEVMTTLYKNTAAFHDITTGTSTGRPNYSATAGYDYVTGLGTPKADRVIAALVGTSSAAVDTLSITAPTSAVAGTSFAVTVTAKTSAGATDTAYAGTVKFTSTDALSGLPANYTFTATDKGVHTFTVTLKSAATSTVTVTDTTTAATTGKTSSIVVSPAAATQLLISGLSSSASIGTPVSFTVTAKDAYGNVASGYTGTVSFASTDTAATLPANYTFLASDKGIRAFGVTFKTAGTHSFTVAGTTGLSVTQSGIVVTLTAPINLAATAASTSQINLTWSASTGATGYAIERSANGTTGWTQIGTTAAGTTSYSNTGLTAGTTYFYRVKATVGSTSSGYSNVASAATTSNTSTGSASSIWSNTYTPKIDAYSWGNYELGVKFRSDVAGNVTGARFFKQTWMNGYLHVGHLWSSNGVLLATAVFTGETASGWEQVNFATPVAIAANTTYIVSFSTGGGYFGISTTFFASAGVDNAPLHALANSTSGGDGVYNSSGRFPNVSGAGMNFWADVAFSATNANHGVIASLSSTTTGTGTTTAIQVAPPKSDSSPTAARTNPARSASQQATGITSPTWIYRRTVPQVSSFSTNPKGLGLE